jgi:hypothetical protein
MTDESRPDRRAERAAYRAAPGVVEEPEASHFMTPGEGVVVEVKAAGVSFPELLQTRGQYQMKPEIPLHPRQRGRRRGAQRPRGQRLCRG